MILNAVSYPDQVHITIHETQSKKKLSGRIISFLSTIYWEIAELALSSWKPPLEKADVGISSKFVSFMSVFGVILCRVQMDATTADRRTWK